jgi:hypothetical protein
MPIDGTLARVWIQGLRINWLDTKKRTFDQNQFGDFGYSQYMINLALELEQSWVLITLLQEFKDIFA